MLSRSRPRPKKASRRVAPRLLALESRLLLTADAMSAPAGSIALPVAILSPTSAATGLGVQGPFGVGEGSVDPAVSTYYTPAQIRHAYGVDQLSYDGTGQTIGIVDAYDAPTIAGDLAAFDSRYNLPAANLLKVSQTGSTTKLPAANSGWDTEISLDVEWAHAIAPGAKILLVEANSDSDTDLLTAVDEAVKLGAAQVSMSWGGDEYSGVSSLNTHFDKPGVTFLASAGDSGEGVEYPAVSPYVTGVGGTTLTLDGNNNVVSETVWAGSGGGVSADVTRPAFQDGFETAADRGVPDVSYDADPDSGVEIDQNGSFFAVGGTSVGAPQWAGLIALANQGRAAAGLTPLGTGMAFGTNTVLYGLAGGTSYTNPDGDFDDITSGSNGVSAGTGYDNDTGLGSPVANKLIPDLIGIKPTPAGTATFVGSDTTTGGSWSGTYGSDGYEALGATASLPGYAAVTPAGQSTFVWTAPPAVASAPLVAPGSSSRLSTTWYSGASFTVDVSLGGSQAHDLSIYLLDWENEGRSERVDVIDPVTGDVLDSRTASSFGGGEYLTWSLSGHVQLRFTTLSGPNAVLEGLFFGNPTTPTTPANSAKFVSADTTTGGSWSGTYGSDGYEALGATASLPGYAAVTPAGQSTFVWTAPPAVASAPLVAPGSSSRLSTTWYSGASFTVDVSLGGSQAHDLSIYLLDWENEGRSERVDVIDPVTGDVLDSRTASSFGGGEYLTWSLSGHVQLRFTTLSGPNAVLEGLFFGNPTTPTTPANSAKFVSADTTTGGSWSGTYGSDGYEALGATASLPGYAAVTPAGQSTFVWTAPPAVASAPLVAPGSSSRLSTTWYSGASFTVDVSLGGSQAHDLSIYLLDWENEGRSERVDVIDPVTGDVLDSRTASSFGGGEYLTWSLSGHVQLRFTTLSGPNAVLEGLFFG